jgi:long-subunit acyl-CoA synthetase (AMP-forming)
MQETVSEVLERTARTHGSRPALKAKRDGRWQATTWEEYRDQAKLVARGFLRLGLQPRDGVVIMGYNRPEWFLADIGAILAGGLPAGIYITNTPEQCQYIAEHAEASVAVVENEQYLQVFLALRDRLPKLKAIVLMTGEAHGEGAHTWDRLLALGGEVPEADLQARTDAQRPDDLCTLIYTSGTTGPPKAVMLTHHNVTWTARRVVEAYGVNERDDMLSYLPLSHIAEQVVSLHCPMAMGACSWFAEGMEKLADNLREVRPQFFFAVPRVWEKMQAGIQAVGAKNPPLKKKISAWARGLGLAAGEALEAGQAGRNDRPFLYGLAHKLVFSKVHERLGLDRARVCATSTAPISIDTLRFFLSLGIPIMEVYGMSECTGPATFSTRDRFRLGKVGYAIAGTGIRLAEDGEVMMRGPHVFPGYFKNEEATREALDAEGWLHSGDIGDLDEKGFLRITDRKKELIITSGGKNIGPQNLENKLKQIPVVSQAVVVGDRRNYLAALLTLDPLRAPIEAEAAGSPHRDPGDLAGCEIFRAHLETQVEEVNRTLARYETIKRFAILPRELSIEAGELTPTLKLKRRVIHQNHAEAIERLYS